MQEQMTGAAMAMPPDPNKAFKVRFYFKPEPDKQNSCVQDVYCHVSTCVFWLQSEWEALEIVEHKWALENVEEELMSRDLNFGAFFSQDVKSTVF